MSRLDDLIAELCQEGVEYHALKQIAQFSKERVNVSCVNADTYIGVDNMLPNKAGKTYSEHLPEKGSLTKYVEGDVLIGNIRPLCGNIHICRNDIYRAANRN